MVDFDQSFIFFLFFFYKHAATPELYALSLHDALPISHLGSNTVSRYGVPRSAHRNSAVGRLAPAILAAYRLTDRKSTRLNSSHRCISYAVFCLKKKNKHPQDVIRT